LLSAEPQPPIRHPVAAIDKPQAVNNLVVLKPVLVKVALEEVKDEDKAREPHNAVAERELAVSRAPVSR
jgi:hypothetical protein